VVAVGAFYTTCCLWTQSSPESSEKFESGTKLEAEPGGEMGLCEQGQATTVDLVVPEHLSIFLTDIDLHDKSGNLLDCPFVWLPIQLHPLRRGGRRRWRRVRRGGRA